jgi:hypothetical protein
MKSHHLQIDKTNPALIINLHTKTVHKFNNEIVGRYFDGKVVIGNVPELLTQQAGAIVVAADAGPKSKSISNYLGSSLDGNTGPPLPTSSLSEAVKLTEGYDHLDKQQQGTKINSIPIRSSNVPKRNLFQKFSNIVKMDGGKFKKQILENNAQNSDEVDNDDEASGDDVDSDEDY